MGILLTIAYDGTNYAGWQVQKNAPTVYGALCEALGQVLNEAEFSLLGASRTDAGVHALGQQAHLTTVNMPKIPIEKFPHGINPLLPRDIAVIDAKIVSDSFHPIADAKSKTYSYKIWNNPHRNPLLCNFSAHIRQKLNIAAIRVSCTYFIGEHDFAAFCAAGSSVKTTVREIRSLEISSNNGVIEILISGNGFLYNMVRIIVGTLVEVGLGKISPKDIPNIILSCDRKKAGKTMPPQGLTLLCVQY